MDLTRTEIAASLDEVRKRIAVAAQRAGRQADEVSLVAVSKTFPVHVIEEALDAGVTDLGENRAQELKEKWTVLGPRARWHFIGNLQTNKVRQVVGRADLIHSVDRPGLAEAISRRALGMGKIQRVLVEVNISGETTKHGCEPAAAPHLAGEVAELEGLELAGVMGMAPFTEDPEDARPYFAGLKEISDRIASEYPPASILSMGMTRDFEIAIEEGATLVRVGEAIFGSRSASASP